MFFFVITIGKYLDKNTNRINISLEEIFKEKEIEKEIPPRFLAKLILKLEEIKAIIPNEDKTEYSLNPWIANCFDEEKAVELASQFPKVEIPRITDIP